MCVEARNVLNIPVIGSVIQVNVSAMTSLCIRLVQDYSKPKVDKDSPEQASLQGEVAQHSLLNPCDMRLGVVHNLSGGI